MFSPASLVCVLALCAASTLRAVSVGDSLDQVLAEKGPPTSKLEAGGTTVLNYPGTKIKLKEGRVASIDSAPVRTPTVAAKPEAPRPEDKPAAPATPTAKPAIRKVAWTTNMNEALVQAREQDRKIFLFFTGSDWCGWCQRLQEEILSTPQFARYAGDKLVLVELDFPRSIQQPPELIEQNRKLAQRFRIRGYPTVVVLNSEGKMVGQLGYQEGGPEPFIQALAKM